MNSDLVKDSELPARIVGNLTHHIVPAKRGENGQVGRQQKEETWRRGRHLGSGGYGTVWLEECVTAGSPPKLRAVKVIQKVAPSPTADYYEHELEAIAKFSQKKYRIWFVRSPGWYQDTERVYIAMEYFDLGDLSAHFQVRLPILEAQQITRQLLEGLEYLHSNGYAHRDLKPANILVFAKGPEWEVKIGDFGISKRVSDGNTQFRTMIGTPTFMAPEVRPEIRGNNDSDSEYTTMVDMWSLDAVVHCMITTKRPFDNSETLKAYYEQRCEFPSSALASLRVDKECHDFITQGLMAPVAASRLSARAALKHPWLKDVVVSGSNGQLSVSSKTRNRLAMENESGKNMEMASSKGSSVESTIYSGRWSAQSGTTSERQPPERMPVLNQALGHIAQRETRSSGVSTLSSATNSPGNAAEQGRIELEAIQEAGISAFKHQRYQKAEEMFRKALHGRENLLGKHHTDTLASAHWLGNSLYHSHRPKYPGAKMMFELALQGRVKSLGYGHTETLSSAHMLGLSLHMLHQYGEAETAFEQASEGRDTLLGIDNTESLDSTHCLGLSLIHQDKNKEAEMKFRKALEGRKKTLGYEHADTLLSTHWSGISLAKQFQHKEAEAAFQQAFTGRERALGPDNEHTLTSLNWLGLSLFEQKKYEDADQIFRKALLGREKKLGYDNEETLTSAQCLGDALYKQKEYKEAEKMFLQALKGREKVLGYNHEKTETSRQSARKAHSKCSTWWTPFSYLKTSTYTERLSVSCHCRVSLL